MPEIAMVPQVDEAARRAVYGMYTDPVRFSRVILKTKLWPEQERIMRAVASGTRRIGVKACHSSGKTFLAACVTLWWISRYPDGLVVTTAPTWLQVEKLLWGEIHALLKRSGLTFPNITRTEIRNTTKNYALGLSTNEGVRFQGFHGSKLLIVLDEAPGVMGDIWDAIDGIRAGGDVTVLALGNPVIASGPFYDAFTKERATWDLHTISAFNTPNFAGVTIEDLLAMDAAALAVSPRPYLTTRAWVHERFTSWGPGHPLWESRVLGEFPSHPEGSLLSLSWVEAARARSHADLGDIVDAGIDVAGPGEAETVLVVRSQGVVLLEQAWAHADSRGEVVAALRPFRERLRAVNVDTAGIGEFFFRALQDEGLPVCAVNVGTAATDPEQHENLKAELYWGLRQRFEAGDLAGAFSELMVQQLVSIRYSHTSRGRVKIESKDDALKRGVKSPDRAEALMLAFARLGGGAVEVSGLASTFGATPRRIDRRSMPR